ncbi:MULTISPECIES: HD-GYP domain-containing protein [Vibrio]|nr:MULTISPECIES: HD domain-containing phosphohydrolase [Vibrio]MCZ2798939.1 HD domain-containing protein [Vibrio alginolyticus]CAH1589241.1 HD-GYP domain-containing protein [Vibrio jasicida]CAH1599627.1 HD-GYP domain-containing protein [Vibrio jasicida]
MELFGIDISRNTEENVEMLENAIIDLLIGIVSLSENNGLDAVRQHNLRCEKIALAILRNIDHSELNDADAMYLNSSPKMHYYLSKACAMHDLGKTTVSPILLNRQGGLTDAEFNLIKEHTMSPERVFEATQGRTVFFFKLLEQCMRSHHERYNGKGYPDGLKAGEIPFVARLMSIIDTVDNIVHRSAYADEQPYEKALQVVLSMRGEAFDPVLVDALLDAKEEISDILITY